MYHVCLQVWIDEEGRPRCSCGIFGDLGGVEPCVHCGAIEELRSQGIAPSTFVAEGVVVEVYAKPGQACYFINDHFVSVEGMWRFMRMPCSVAYCYDLQRASWPCTLVGWR